MAHAKLVVSGHGGSSRALRAAFLGIAGASPVDDRALVAADVADLPLVELPGRGTRIGVLAVILSGDGGWANIDRDIGTELAAHGVDVVGLDSLRYFWTRRKPPDGAAADLGRILRRYLAAWHARRVLLLGYSRGADVLPFMANRLPPALQARVALVGLLGPSTSVDFQFHLSDWIADTARTTALPVRPEVEKLRGMPILCIHGEDESDSLCPKLDAGLATRMPQQRRPPLRWRRSAIVARILELAGVTPTPRSPDQAGIRCRASAVALVAKRQECAMAMSRLVRSRMLEPRSSATPCSVTTRSTTFLKVVTAAPGAGEARYATPWRRWSSSAPP